jgi:hypothetical protein
MLNLSRPSHNAEQAKMTRPTTNEAGPRAACFAWDDAERTARRGPCQLTGG